MTPEKQRIAIAEACGWHSFRAGAYDGQPFGMLGLTRAFMAVPDYLNDLNAMHEAEKVLMGKPGFGLWRDAAHQYWGTLIAVTTCDQFMLIHATAAQRAEAFLRTIGKWEGA